MSDVLVYERASASFAAGLAKRGHHIVYRANEANHCPGCGRSQWYIGRVSAECGFCGTAVPLAETSRHESVPASPRPRNVSPTADQRRFLTDQGCDQRAQIFSPRFRIAPLGIYERQRAAARSGSILLRPGCRGSVYGSLPEDAVVLEL